MKRIFSIAILSFAFILILATPLIIGHRGYPILYPENTLLSFRKAIESGADGVELDVRSTKDGVLVIIHDERIDELSNGEGKVRDLTFKEVRKYDFGMKEKIPTLEEVLEELPSTCVINIEIKEKEDAREVALLVKKTGRKNVIFSSFDPDSLEIVKKVIPDAEIGLILRKDYLAWKRLWNKSFLDAVKSCVKGLPVTHLMLPIGLLEIMDEEEILGITEDIRKKGIKVFFWTVNDPEVFRLLYEYADGIITDDPELIRDLIEKCEILNHH